MAKIEKVSKDSIEKVELIERIPTTSMDVDRLAEFCSKQLQNIESDRNLWIDRRRMYLQSLDNFVRHENMDAPFEGASKLHIPVTMEKVRATHARLFQAIFAMPDSFYVEPQERMDQARVWKIKQLMRWATSRFINHYEGIQDCMDEFLWNFASEGWGVLHLKWDRDIRKALVVEEELVPKKKSKADVGPDGTVKMEPSVKFVEKFKFVNRFEGPVVENIEPEDCYFPGIGDLQKVPLVGVRTRMTRHQLELYKAIKFFDAEAVDKVVDQADTYGVQVPLGGGTGIKDTKGYNQGVEISSKQTMAEDFRGMPSEYEIVKCYCSFDGDKDGMDEELVVYFHPTSKTVLRWTYLDRITQTGRRPVYTAGYIKRPGRNYHIGLCELLDPLNTEVDAVHNQRVDTGTLANFPFFFVRANSSLPNETIKLKPGEGIPIDDPQSDVFFPQMGNRTGWGFQEESLLFQIISRVSSISDLNLGMTPSNSEAVRSQGQMAALLQEGNAQLDISLRRVQRMYGQILGDLHQMLVEKLPRDFQYAVIGDDNSTMAGPNGDMVIDIIKEPRRDIAGRVNFHIKANSQAGNKAQQRTNRVALFQQLMNPMNVQMGIITPDNLYEMSKALIEASDELEINRFITKPQNAPKPLSLEDELYQIRQGIVPEIPLNDVHEEKIQAILAFISSPQVQEGIKLGTFTMNALIAAEQAVQKHQQFMQMIKAQTQAFQNNTGSQIPTGVVNNRGMMGAQGAGAGAPQPPQQQAPQG